MPESLLVIPFPSLKLKGLIKYIEREDSSKRGGFTRGAITFLFKEADDVVFYIKKKKKSAILRLRFMKQQGKKSLMLMIKY